MSGAGGEGGGWDGFDEAGGADRSSADGMDRSSASGADRRSAGGADRRGAGGAGDARTRDAGGGESSGRVLVAVVLLFLALLGAAGLKSYRDLQTARAGETQLETRIEETRRDIDRLRGRIDRLRVDPAMLERLAREDLGMVRPRDVVIELPAAQPNASRP